MLVEIRQHSETCCAYLPADPEHYPEYCYHVDERDWRGMVRLLAPERSETDNLDSNTPFRQARYRFAPAAAQPFLAAAEPYEKENAGAG